MLVIAFPTLGAFLTIAFLNLVFFGRVWPAQVLLDIVAGIPDQALALQTLYTTPTGWLVMAPVASAWLVALIVRRPATILVSLLVFVMINVAFLLGAFHPGAAGVTFVLLTMLAITLIPGARTPLTNVFVDLVAVLQIAIAWATAVDRDIVVAWMQWVADAALIVIG